MISLLVISIFAVFSVKSEVFQECNQTISQREFIIESVGYPHKYPENIKCDYFLKSHACETEFHFQFLDFDLQDSVNCSKDRLEVNNENLCGYLTGYRMYKTNGSYLRLKLVSDYSTSGRGFKILVTRLPCELNATNKLPKCCGDFYNSRRFYLSSPGFPNYKGPNDCYYHIYRANPNICRLRIHFNYFNVGLLEIDGKQINGCQTDLDLISEFDQFWGNTPKIIHYKNNQYFKDDFNGFAIEVIQDECPLRYSPSLKSTNTNIKSGDEKSPEFYFYNDQLNRITWPNTTKKEPKVRIDYYFFKAPENDDPLPEIKEKEPRSYFDTTDNFLPPNNEHKCKSWGLEQWNTLSNDVLWKKMPQCEISEITRPEVKCYDVRQFRGMLNNPGYPFFYFPDLNCCFRFHKIDGYCGIHFYVNDFDLELSPDCQKDAFVLYNQYKYCGNTLAHSQFSFDLTQKKFEDIKFTTDSCVCGRGFSLYYEHIPCVYPTTPTPPVRPSCGADITTAFFEINISNAHEQCIYNIHRLDEDVCGVRLEFLNFNLLCGTEYLVINNQQYCGNMNGQSFKIDFGPDNKLLIKYQRRNVQTDLSNIFLRGQQLKNCLEVPAQRIRQMKPN